MTTTKLRDTKSTTNAKSPYSTITYGSGQVSVPKDKYDLESGWSFNDKMYHYKCPHCMGVFAFLKDAKNCCGWDYAYVQNGPWHSIRSTNDVRVGELDVKKE